LFLLKKYKKYKMAPIRSTASAAEPIPIPAFAPVDNALEVGFSVEEELWLVVGAVVVLPELDVAVLKLAALLALLVLELVVATPSVAAKTISWPVPQHAVLCVPQHHFSDVGVPSQGVISSLLLPSYNEISSAYSFVVVEATDQSPCCELLCFEFPTLENGGDRYSRKKLCRLLASNTGCSTRDRYNTLSNNLCRVCWSFDS
jgi:hypothetical protein